MASWFSVYSSHHRITIFIYECQRKFAYKPKYIQLTFTSEWDISSCFSCNLRQTFLTYYLAWQISSSKWCFRWKQETHNFLIQQLCFQFPRARTPGNFSTHPSITLQILLKINRFLKLVKHSTSPRRRRRSAVTNTNEDICAE